MTKDEKGMTIVSLVVTIIVMLIIFGVTVVSSTVLLDHAKLTKIETTLYFAKGRAETLIEQYSFDNDLKSLILYSFEGELKRNTIYSGNNIDSVKTVQIDSDTYTAIIDDNDFENKLKLIYSTEIWNVEFLKGLAPYPNLLAVKWDEEACIAQGVLKQDDKDNILNKGDYIIVVYNLYKNSVESIAYSKGYKGNNKLVYTLDQMLTIDKEEN